MAPNVVSPLLHTIPSSAAQPDLGSFVELPSSYITLCVSAILLDSVLSSWNVASLLFLFQSIFHIMDVLLLHSERDLINTLLKNLCWQDEIQTSKCSKKALHNLVPFFLSSLIFSNFFSCHI